MNADNQLQKWAYGIGISAGLVIILAALKLASDLIAPFLMAAFFATIASPPIYWLQQKRVPRSAAVLLVILGFVALWMVAMLIVGNSLLNFKDDLPEYQAKVETQTTKLIEWLESHGMEDADKALTPDFNPGKFLQYLGGFLGQVGVLVGDAFLILLTVIFILAEQSSFPAKLRAILPNPDKSLAQFSSISENVRRYLVIKTVVSFITGVGVTIVLLIIGVDYPLLWGFLAFMLNYVPTVGSYIAAVPAVLLALVQLGPVPCVFTIAGYAIVNVLIGNVIEPRFMGRGLGLSTLVVFVSLVFWGYVLGIVGTLLSVPLTMIVKIILAGDEDTRWIAVLLGTEADAESALAREDGTP